MEKNTDEKTLSGSIGESFEKHSESDYICRKALYEDTVENFVKDLFPDKESLERYSHRKFAEHESDYDRRTWLSGIEFLQNYILGNNKERKELE